MADPFRRDDPLLGIGSFAPEFWRLLAEPADEPRGAMPQPAPPPVVAPDLPEAAPPASPESRQLPPLTNDALEALRDSLGGRVDSLQDIPPPPIGPYPPFTGYGPPLTNSGYRDLRDFQGGFGELQDIPSSRPEYLRPFPTPEYSKQLADKIKKLSGLRREIERMEAEKRTRPESQRQAFDDEISSLNKQIESAEQELADQAKKIHGNQKFPYGDT